jgi:peptide/nickel transport system ATP-binding protein
MELRDVTKIFQARGLRRSTYVRAVDDVSFTLERGRISALVGESGSGKSTIAALIVKLYRPTNGALILKGEDVTRLRGLQAVKRYRSHVQMIFQDPFASLNPVHNVGYQLNRAVAIHRKTHGADATEDIWQLLETVGLTPPKDIARKYPHELSGGQRQRVAIASTLAVAPELIVADEPTSMLDVSIRVGILNLLRALRDERNIGLLYITHDLASARYVADETMVLYAGQLVEKAPSRELMHAPLHPYTALLLSAAPKPRGVPARTPVWTDGQKLARRTGGCRFAPRCPLAIPKCRETAPGLDEVRPGHFVRCYLPGAAAGPADQAPMTNGSSL